MDSHSADDLRARAWWDVDHGLSITTAPTTTLPARLAPGDAIQIPKGASWTLYVTWYDNTSTPFDVSNGYTAAFTVRIGDGETALVSLADTDAIALAADAPNITITRSAAETAAFDFVRGWGQLTLTRTSDGHAFRLVEGFVDLVGQS